MNIEDFSYYLPTDHIAQKPACPRDHSRLMVLDRRKNNIEHCFFYQLPHFLSNDDLLVMNNSRVIPARLYGHKITGGSVEILLLHRKSTHIWEAITHPGLRMHQSVYLIPHTTTKNLTQNVTARVVEKKQDGTTRLHFNVDLNRYLSSLGHTPLPPYIKNLGYKARWYQTLYAIKKAQSQLLPQVYTLLNACSTN